MNDIIKEEVALIRSMRGHLYARAREDLLAFIMAMHRDYDVNWHHRIVTDRLTKMIYENGQRLMVFQPPQTGKSEIVSRMLPAWLLGRNPNLRIIIASYSAELAISFNRDTQKIMSSEAYQKVFPDTILNGKRNVTGQAWKRTSNYFETVGQGGYLFSVGVGGATTGKSADVFIIDDPIKDWKQAYSKTYRKATIDWYNSVAQTRMSKNGHVIVMHTRWHEGDLAGYLLNAAKESEENTQWEVISLPATGLPASEYKHPLDLRERGEPLWPSFKGDAAALAKIRSDVGDTIWSALYQQSPKVDGGNIIKDAWINYYVEAPFQVVNIRQHNSVQSWDLTFKETGTSYVVGVLIVLWENDFYIVDMFRKRCDIVDTIEGITAMTQKYRFSSILIENKANGPAVMSLLKKKIPHIIPVEPDASKDERLHAVAPIFEQGRVHFPMNAPWVKEAVHELQTFPNSANDDIVDAISQGLRHFNTQQGLRHLKATSKW